MRHDSLSSLPPLPFSHPHLVLSLGLRLLIPPGREDISLSPVPLILKSFQIRLGENMGHTAEALKEQFAQRQPPGFLVFALEGDWSPQRKPVLHRCTGFYVYEQPTASLGYIMAWYLDCIALVIIPSVFALWSPVSIHISTLPHDLEGVGFSLQPLTCIAETGWFWKCYLYPRHFMALDQHSCQHRVHCLLDVSNCAFLSGGAQIALLGP